jgi:hypothetical protein
MNLFKASSQWSSRPADERFWTIGELAEEFGRIMADSSQATVYYGDLRAEAIGEEINIVGQKGQSAKLCNWAFGQLAQRVKAPAEYLRSLPPSLAVQNINYGLARRDLRDPTDEAKLLLHRQEGGFLARCFTSSKYRRIWNCEIAKQLQRLEVRGWKIPPARPAKIYGERVRKATQEDVLSCQRLGLAIKVGDDIAPAGVYASDRDMFVFMVDDNHTIANPLAKDVPLARGFFVWNSEVGDKTFGIMTFLYEAVCGNHIVWGASAVKEIKMRHVGDANVRAFSSLRMELREYADSSSSELERNIVKAQTYQIAATKEDVITQLLSFTKKRKLKTLKESELRAAYAIAETTPRYGNPRTPWAITQGLTQLNQLSDHADNRTEMDREAGKILEIAF